MADRDTGSGSLPTDRTLLAEDADDHAIASLATLPAGEPVEAASPSRSAGAAGRYVLLEQIGAGGVGIVYRAYDPELGRRVAVKILRAEGRSPSRMLREAQALARLAHPNVIHVYDAGICDRGVFIAMEYGDGVTLRSWLEVKERSVKEILSLFRAAGRGLAAAHRAGLVHRDFKPDNVLVGDDGRVRVLDFGLACAATDELDTISQDEDRAVGDGAVDYLQAPLTRTGTLLGTPRYMSPEQHLRRKADARTDQFSFCVALYEALHGHPPFAGRDLYELASSVTKGRRATRAARRELPRSIQRALDRGLSVEPADRYASMRDLLRDLDLGSRRTAPRLALAAAVLAMLATVFLVRTGRESATRAASCDGATERLAGVWNNHERARIEAAFHATGQPAAADSFARATARIDDYAAAWEEMHVESCMATRVHGHQSEAIMDLRTQCLERRRGELGALVDLLGNADEQVVTSAVDAAYALPSLSACADASSLQGIAALPADDGLRERIASIRESMAAVSALHSAGKYRDALEDALALLPAARDVDYGPLTAEVLYLIGYLEEKNGDVKRAEELLREAIVESATAGDRAGEARSWAELLWVVGYGQERFEDAMLLRPAVEATLAHTQDALAHAWANNSLGALHYRRGEYDRAQRYFEESLKQKRAALAPGHPELAKSLSNLGFLAIERGDSAGAVRNFREAAQIVEDAYGPEHGDLAVIQNGLGRVANSQGRYEDARQHCQRALAIDRIRLGESHPDLAFDLACLGEALAGTREWDVANAALERALALMSSATAPDTDLLATVRTTLARTRAQMAL